MRATTLANIVKFSVAALVLSVALAVSGAAFAQATRTGGATTGATGGATTGTNSGATTGATGGATTGATGGATTGTNSGATTGANGGTVGRTGPSAPSGPSALGGNDPRFLPGPDATSCDLGPTLPTPPMFGEAGDAVKDLSRATESYIRNCGCATQTCIANALDKYAEALAQVAPRLPPHLQNSAGIVATAAMRLRVARTKKDVARALNDAIAAIHKDIELVKAEDPDNPRLTRGGEFVAETLTVASLALEKGGGL